MNDVSFNIDSMDFAYKDSLKYEKKLSDSASGLAELSGALETEISSFSSFAGASISRINSYMAEVRAMIDAVESKRSAAESKRSQELTPPSPPSVPDKASAEQRQAIMNAYRQRVNQIEEANRQIREQNNKIDSYVKGCDRAISRLRDILSRLAQLESMVRKEASQSEAAAKEDLTSVKNEVRSLPMICQAMKSFASAFSETFINASELYEMVPSEIERDLYADGVFIIKNRHGSVTPTHIFANPRHGEPASSTKKNGSVVPENRSEGAIINDSEAEAFIKAIDGLLAFKMPGVNLHRLGGREFINRMKTLGYRVKPMPDGRITDQNGIMHWEKKYE